MFLDKGDCDERSFSVEAEELGCPVVVNSSEDEFLAQDKENEHCLQGVSESCK